ncbi:MAG: RsmD family RNA methyltransferase [Bacteroidales bacterium]|nr:RsmD family RNA methyltransferase [Bacteroidales bacterium]
MRIIRGSRKGRKIFPPKGFSSRPTTDYAKESLFNILENKYEIENLNVLDLFSGTGNISLEFFSRGCKSVTSVEISRKNCLHIKNQISNLFSIPGNVISADVYKFCLKADLSYDIIFADPPFSDEKINTLPRIILNNETAINSLLILEHSANFNFENNKYFKETKKYGNVNFSFFKK